MKKLLSLALSAVIALSLVACTSAPQSKSEASSASQSSLSSSQSVSEQGKITADRAGKPITLPAQANKIISMATSITQQLCDMGLADKIIAVDTYSPLVATGLKSDVIQMDMLSPDVEQIVALSPDIVFTTSMSAAGGADPYDPVRSAGICVVELPTSASVDAVMEDVQFVADCVGESKKGEALVDEMKKVFAEVKNKAKAITEKKSVLFEISAAPDIYSFGSEVFLNEMLLSINAVNILADQSGWLAVTEESAVSKNPDVILTNVNYVDDAVADIKARAGWQEVNAVKNNEVYYIDNNASSLPNHHIADALLQMAQAIYPEIFK